MLPLLPEPRKYAHTAHRPERLFKRVAQPLITLLFGNLARQFVTFQTLVNNVDAGDQEALDSLPAAAASFRHKASKDALYLVFIGTRDLRGPSFR